MPRARSTRFLPGTCISLGVLLVWGAPLWAQASFRRGDANNDGSFDVSDAVYTVRLIFLGDAPAGCDDAVDVDDNGILNVTDAIYSVRYLFQDGTVPPEPFLGCGPDPTEDGLGCEASAWCPGGGGECLDDETLNELFSQDLSFSFCLPAGLLTIPIDRFTVDVCPSDLALACGTTQTPGCEVEISSVAPSVDAAQRRIAMRFEGRIAAMPVRVTETIFNSTTNCSIDLRGSQADAPFSFVLAVPLDVVPVEPGVEEITGVGEVTIAEQDIAMAASGGLVCLLFQLGQQAFIDLILEQFRVATQTLVDGAGDGLVGLRLCSG